MRTEFVNALAHATDQISVEGKIESIKKAVHAELRLADPSVTARFTDYFNHLVVPDMVLRWPNESKERLLFVRPSSDRSWLANDVATLAQQRPVIFTLDNLDGRVEVADSDGGGAALDESARSADTWIADSDAVVAVGEARRNSPILGLLGQALVRGGRGVATKPTIEWLTATTQTAFAKAQELDAASTGAGVGALEAGLESQQAGRLTRVLRAVWEGHGGVGSQFPTVASTGPLTDDDLAYLLETLTDASADFWRRVGKSVSTAQLARLHISDPSQALQQFVEGNLDRLLAKGLRAGHQQVRLGESDEFPRWLIDRGCLALRGLEWIAHFAARKAEELPPIEEGKAISLDAIKDRAASARGTVTRLEFGKGDRAVSYESKERLSVLEDEDLARLAADVLGLNVERASLALLGGGTANVEFASRTALGPTNSALPLDVLVRTVLPFVASLSEEERGALTAMVPPDDEGLFPAIS